MPTRILTDRDFQALEELSRVLPLPTRRERPIDFNDRAAPMTLYANIGELTAFGRQWRNKAEQIDSDGSACMTGSKA